MAEAEESESALLFFDTFSHEEINDINLDLVQFPKPVYITQVRIIPLGARVQADFPGGVRLGATNPSKFDIEFFVNDLGMPGASAFENLGQLRYNQNDCIHLECTQEKIPTDGLVLRGWYSTITLAVYGILTNSVTEPIASPTLQCDPVVVEELCNLSGDGLNADIQEDNLKDEWQENIAGELRSRKASVSDYDPDDMEYSMQREHYRQHSESDQRDMRRLRRSPRSTERSPTHRTRTHSESNERDYIRSRDKLVRDWSRSPDYSSSRRQRRKRSERSRSDAEDSHKWPRTPPASIDSPSRPRSPDTMEYDDEDSSYKIQKTHGYRQSSESIVGNVLIEDEETSGTPNEQFEPILSDDEIPGDEDEEVETVDEAAAAQLELEINAEAAAAPPAINCFDPWKLPLRKYEADLHVYFSKELENLRLLFKKFGLQTKCDNVKAHRSTLEVSVEEREQFVHLGEQLNNQLAYLALQFKRRNFVMQQFFKSDESHRKYAANILQISLDFESACLQPQPAYKIRHIKVGARLAELLCNTSDFFTYLLDEHNFDVFDALFKLYNEQYMALSIKLQLLKAVYTLLDNKVALNHFLVTKKTNGYQMIMETIKDAKLTRTKYSLLSIIRKLHLYEALAAIRENCTQLFVLTNFYPTDQRPIVPFQHIEHAFEQLLDAIAANALSYQQPRRFLPVSKKFEIVWDVAAQRSFGNALQSYFVQHSLAESLLILLTNVQDLPPTTYLCTLDMVHALLQSYVGLNYFVDDAFETTQLLVSVLLGLDDVPIQTPIEIKEEVKVVEKEEAKEEDSIMNSQETVENATEPVVEINTDEQAPLESIVNPTPCEKPVPKILKPEKQPVRHIYDHLGRLGIEMAYKVQTRYHLDAITFTSTSNDFDAIKLATHLHALYSQTCDPVGRQHTVEVIGMNNNLQIFMDLIKKEQRLQAQRQLSSPGAKYKSPVLSYAVDIVDCCVRYCDQLDYLTEHGTFILELAKNHETFEPSVSAVLQELYVYVKPLETINVFAYDDITPLVEVLTRSLDYITTFPGDLIMVLRILRHLAINKRPVTGFKSSRGSDTEELKHRFVALQFYAADGVQILTELLEKMCIYFEQPGLHAPALTTIQGVHCCQILLPTLQILRELISFAIQCRDTEFKDLTAIDYLMRIYLLLYYYPCRSQAAADVELARQEVVQTLLAYTQPNEQDEESLHKSLWTQMIRELLKNIDGPSSFIPGLQLLAELLPLPLPMPLPISEELQKQQKQRLITERKLWSAHLHPQSAQIAKLIETLAPSSFPQLSELLQRVCMQLSDLAPNMTLLIAKTIIDMLCNEWQTANSVPTPQLARLLNFSARLCAFAPLKSSTLSILSGKFWDLFQGLLLQTEMNDVICKCQVAVHRILESFLDSNISLIAHKSTAQPALNLASALPPKELIPRIIEAILGNLFNVEVVHGVSALAVRNLVIMTEHDFTFYHLVQILKHKSTEFQEWMEKVIVHNESTNYNSNIESLILLLRSLTQIEPPPKFSSMPQRMLKLSANELTQIINFQETTEEVEGTDIKPHILQRILNVLEKHKDLANEDALRDLRQLIQLLTTNESPTITSSATGTVETVGGLVDEVNGDDEASASSQNNSVTTEPSLPQAEGLVTQYDGRPIFTRFHASPNDDKLTARYWLDPLPIEIIEDFDEPLYERIPCDLSDLADACLTPDMNITGDCKRVLHLSGSPQSNRERTPTAPCFRTRRVEVEPSTGRPEKKMFISTVRGRGFSRPPPSRGDLFRSRPPNTSRPPSLHVDDFLALETCGAQPTGPTGYNKIPSMLRGSRVGRNRGSRISAAAAFRQKKLLRTSSPSTWSEAPSGIYRSSNSESHFANSAEYSVPHFSSRARGRGPRTRPYMR